MTCGVFPADLAVLHVADVGKQYQPSNGTEGEIFQHAWCEKCARELVLNGTVMFDDCDPETQTCQILNASFRGEATEWVIGKDGQPLCTAFVPFGESVPAPRCEHTLE